MTSYTPAQLTAFNTPSAELTEHVKARPIIKTYTTDMIAARHERAAYLAALRHLTPYTSPDPAVTEHDVFISASDGYQITVRVYEPTTPPSTEGCPVVVLFHEGGWMMGDLSDEDFNARLAAKELGAVGINVEYRLAPEHPFPTGVLDCWTVLQKVASEPGLFSRYAKPEMGLVLGGSSAGGNISALLAHRSREEGLTPAVTGQWLSVAYLVPRSMCPDRYRDIFGSMDGCRDDPVIGDMSAQNEKVLHGVLQLKEEDDALWTPFARDLYPPMEQMEKGKAPLARAFFQVGGMDPLRDHSIVYEKALREEWGVETRMKIYGGYGHMFWTNWPEMEMSKTFFQDLIEGLRWLLRK